MKELVGLSMVVTTTLEDYCVHFVDSRLRASWLAVYSESGGLFICEKYEFSAEVKTADVVDAFKTYDVKIIHHGHDKSPSSLEIIFFPDSKEKKTTFFASKSEAKDELRLSEFILSLGRHGHSARFNRGHSSDTAEAEPGKAPKRPTPAVRKRKIPRGVVFEDI